MSQPSKYESQPSKYESQRNDHNLPMVKAFKSNGIKHTSLYKNSDTQTTSTYPDKWDYKCCNCMMYFDTVPIFAPQSYDVLKAVFYLSPFANCSLSCAKCIILNNRKDNMPERLSLLAEFAHKFFGIKTSIPCIPLTSLKTVSPNGYLTEDEYKQQNFSVVSVVQQPPILFVDTWLEEIAVEGQERDRQKKVSVVNSMTATPEQQMNYNNSLSRVVHSLSSNTTTKTKSHIIQQMVFNNIKNPGHS